jgi:hypothetical protein
LASSPPDASHCARALGVQLEADADRGLHAHLGAHAQHALELARLLERDHHVLAELAAPQREADEVVVLEAVAADQRVGMRVLHEDQRQLGLAAGLEAGGVARAVLGDRLDDHAPLVDLDRVDALVARLVTGLTDRGLERLVDAVQPVLDDLREAQDHRQRAPLGLEPLDDGGKRDPRGLGAAQQHLHVAIAADLEVAARPGGDGVQLLRVGGLERGFGDDVGQSWASSGTGAGPLGRRPISVTEAPGG